MLRKQDIIEFGQSMEHIAQFIQQIDLPVQLLNHSGDVVLANKEFCRLFHLPSGEEGESHDDRDHKFCPVKDEADSVLAQQTFPVQPVRVSKKVRIRNTSDNQQKLDDGVLMHFNLIPLVDENGEITCLACTANADLNQDEKFENELLKIQKGENLEILASGVAHEFNNIFTGIKGLTDLIKSEVDQVSDVFEYSQMIQQNINRGAGLIEQLSTFARQIPHSLKPRRIRDYLEQAIPLLQIQVSRRIKLDTDIHTDAVVLLDKSRMDQALSNIMHNAKDAMGGQGKIIVSAHHSPQQAKSGLDLPDDQQWIVIEIADSGPGIPESMQHRVLEPFFSTKEQGKSTGLGLSVTSRIVTSHHGLMEIGKSEKLGGAAIRIYLPAEERPEQ